MRPLRDLMGEALAGLADTPEEPSGNPQPSPVPTLDAVIPRLLRDPHLEPVDKVVWLVIRQHTAEHPQAKTLPRYRGIARRANIGSASTVSRAVAILRATRWLSIHAEVRASDGRFTRNGYCLHQTPLPMDETVAADPDYLLFLHRACKHHHARVRRVAHWVLTAFEASRKTQVDKSDAVADATAVPRAAEQQSSGLTSLGGNLSYSTSPMTRLQNARPSVSATDRNRKSNAVEPVRSFRHQQSNSRSSSCCLYKTTTPETADGRNSNRGAAAQLVYPERLTPRQRESAARHLAEIPDGERQAVLDELAGRLRAERQGAKPVYDALSYLRHLCARVKAGDFEANLGLKVQLERRQRQEEAERCRRARVPRQSAEQRQGAPRVRRDVSSQLAALKAALGRRPRAGADRPSSDEA